ncbi:MAG TPA: chemotaxis protein CheB [Longimicrobium sp.]|nr:chemotaxis protein CheB [Longimicrobium sp.]
MQGHDLIVIGGSAGALDALSALVSGLPEDLPAAVCVVVHQPASAHSHLAEILDRTGLLAAVPAQDGAPLLPGTIYVAVPDKHLLVRADGHGGGTLRLANGPRENRTRPSVDPLFRSAALAYGPRLIGVVLSGALDDGTAGLWAVRDRGGLAVVQDPSTALVASMPTNALNEVGADHVVPAHELGPLLGGLARLPSAAPPPPAATEALEELTREVAITALDESAHAASPRYGTPSRFGCPDCGGVLWDASTVQGGPLRFRCSTGHAYSPGSLAEAQMQSLEAALWASLRALENAVELARARGERASRRGMKGLAQRYTVEYETAQQHAGAVRQLLRMDGRSMVGAMEGG